MSALDTEIETKIREFFDRNLAELQAEGGHALAPEVRRVALEQVRLYWRKLRGIAEKVTDTEVKLNLPGQKTPHGRTFGIEGIVDIVREEDRTVLYDIKTHDADLGGPGGRPSLSIGGQQRPDESLDELRPLVVLPGIP